MATTDEALLAAESTPADETLPAAAAAPAAEPGDDDMPGDCVYCWGSGVIEDYDGDRDCSGCDGTGTPVDRTRIRGRR